jgi:hypothetical protein
MHDAFPVSINIIEKVHSKVTHIKRDTYGKEAKYRALALKRLKTLQMRELKALGWELLHSTCNPTNLTQLYLNN